MQGSVLFRLILLKAATITWRLQREEGCNLFRIVY